MTENARQPRIKRRAGPALGNWFRAFWALVVAVVACSIYFNSLHNPFLFDDQIVILSHPDVQHPSGILKLWTHDYWLGSTEDKNLYRPLTILSFNLNGLFGFEPMFFRAVNIALLALIAIFGSRWAGRYIRREAAWLSAFFFICHPANVEAINSVVARADLQSLLGIVIFLHVQRNMLDRGGWTKSGMASALAAALLAVGSKESGLVVVPLAFVQALACGWLAREGVSVTNSVHSMFDSEAEPPMSSSSGLVIADPNQEAIEVDLDDDKPFEPLPLPPDRPPPRPMPVPTPMSAPGWRAGSILAGGHIVAISIALGAAALYLIARLIVVGKSVDYSQSSDDLTGNPVRAMGFFERLPAVFENAWIYTRQIFCPDLSMVLTPETLGGWTSPTVIAGAMISLITLLSLALYIRWRQWIAVVLTLIVGHFLIIGNLLVPIGVFATNRLTLPFTLAASFLLGAIVHKAIIKAMLGRPMGLSFVQRQSPFAKWVSEHPWIAPALFAFGLVAMSLIVVRGNQQWRSEIVRTMADVSHDEEHPVRQYNLGTAFANAAPMHQPPAAFLERAEAYLTSVVSRRPDSVQARLQLAGVYWKQNKLDLAEGEYRVAQQLKPEQAVIAERLGVLLMIRQNFPAAEAQLQKALALKPNDAEILYNLAEIAKIRGKFTEAVTRYTALLKLHPEHEKARAQFEELARFLEQQANPGTSR